MKYTYEISPKTPSIEESKLPSVSLGLCQVETKEFDFEGNRARALNALHEAGRQRCEIALTPECVLHGYGFADDLIEQHRLLTEQAETKDGRFVNECKAIAKQYEMAIACGYAEIEGSKFYNATTLINKEGVVVSHYRKVHLRDFESKQSQGLFSPGDSFPVVELKTKSGVINIGLMICFDREIPESVRSLRLQGAELILCPLACDTCRLDDHYNFAENEMVTRVRAAENEVYIAVVNHSERFNGGSMIIDHAGKAICQLGETQEVRKVDLPIQALRDKIHSNKFGWMGWGYRRPEVYKTYLD